MMALRIRAGLLLAVLVLGGCGRPTPDPGTECELNTECDARLVCRLDRCRIECRAQRDCPVGQLCVRDEAGLGACQLPDERECVSNSDCPEPLVCQFGTCTNVCNVDRDCPAGATCVEQDGARACVDLSETECELTSDCVDPLLICAVDHRCRNECVTDRDCRDGERCRTDLYERPVCASEDELPDAGGDADAGAGPLDGGDAGATASVPSWLLLAAGLAHTCGTRASGDTACWGANGFSQLGNASTTDSATAVTLSVPGATVVGAGAQHSCAATTTELFCWGNNDRDQVGTGGATVPMPDAVSGLPAPITELALGNDHSCAIAGGRLFCWGANNLGQLGLGDNAPRATPTEVGVAGTPVQVSVFSNTSCVRFAAGTCACFGDGGLGQIGNGATADQDRPTAVSGLTDAIQIAAGTTFACALRATGEVVCWGNNFAGQLGDGTMTASATPTATSPIPDPVRQIAVGSAHACARTDTDLYCWGDNTFAQIAMDTAMGTSVRTPRRVAGLSAPIDAVGVGTNHTCIRSGRNFQCFGDNMRGQLGNGTTSAREHIPQNVVWP